ncbi:hypothetical protein D5086_020144 [Populus alba]|uniref:Uncharacterized protein n=1 Tax=Populus alba TaxID=43335 RepID=A0ACC4BJ88_POPAL
MVAMNCRTCIAPRVVGTSSWSGWSRFGVRTGKTMISKEPPPPRSVAQDPSTIQQMFSGKDLVNCAGKIDGVRQGLLANR